MTSSRRLNWAANLALLLSLSGLAWASWVRYGKEWIFPPAFEGSRELQGKTPFRHDAQAPAIAGTKYSSRTETLLLFVSTTCAYCKSSVGFYNTLHQIARDSGGKVSVVPVFRESAEIVAAYRASTGLKPTAVSGVDFARFGIRQTPTALLVDKDGKVTGNWVGTTPEIDRHIQTRVKRGLWLN
jgi:thiol-disulfide isomerase/thioredoxin